MNTRLRRVFTAYLFASPAILGLILLILGPMLATLVLSFTNWNVLARVKWIGIENYVSLFTTNPFFFKSLLVTAYFAGGNMLLALFWSLVAALLLNQNVRGRPVFRTLFYLPSIVPAVASSLLWLWLYNPDFGLFNAVLQFFGLPKGLWLSGEGSVVPSIIVMNVWSTSGNTIVLFLAGLQGVPRQLLDAVEIDGGGAFRKFRTVTLPMISPVMFFNLVIGLIGSFQVFTQAYVMTNGGPNNDSLFYVFLIYREAFELNHMGLASALAWVLFVVISGFTALIFRTARSWVYYEGGSA